MMNIAILIILAFSGLMIWFVLRPKKKSSYERTGIYDVLMTEKQFRKIAIASLRCWIDRIEDFYVEDGVAYFEVMSQRGISTWNFCIDFNDGGRITGRYHINSDNIESGIPQKIANRMETKIRRALDQDSDYTGWIVLLLILAVVFAGMIILGMAFA
ncbi:hypothetical protein [Butyrivibrio sp. YAB3001]|uniref:hypothetical protein n=1 Tax=Butyrivibrio sp. YAB3001 TaxID=1520812 RepID=UPI0008F61CB0|nr:hypothetical protein [Butyrivibrio sp. YAB3001]SFC55581.1 hypothetical protein SAMN02910398_02550 [Butyrivibrio sp. YAB3001]